MTTITFNGGPFDGDVCEVPGWDAGRFEYGCVKRSDAGGLSKRYAVYLPGERGDLNFHAYARSLAAGLAMLPKENRR